MIHYYVVSILFLITLFIMFLVVSKTLNGVINHLMKIEYLVQREKEYFLEGLEVRQLLASKIDEAGTRD